jgi:glycosyltransferase involved in cell wall biosynthesis
MQIAFDATVLQGRKSGVGYYCEYLLRSMLEADHETDFFVFSHQPLALDAPLPAGKLQCSTARHFPVRAVYLHALLPGILNRVQPDLCHYTNFLAPISERRPYVVTIHDMGLEALRACHPLMKRLYTRNLIPRVARGARLILTNSEYSKWEIVRYLHICEDRIRVTPLAAAPEFSPTGVSPSLVGNSAPYFLYVGNLEPRKNLLRLLDAFALLKSDHELWIVGNDWYRSAPIHQRVRALGIRNRVRFLGYVPRADLPGLYRGATAFVYPSLLEGFGLPVIEAMACGTPVITSNNSALKEIAAGAALLIDPEDVQSIANGMGLIAEERAEREQLRCRGLKRAAEFSWEKTAALTLDAYREAIGQTATYAVGQASSSEEISYAIRKTVDYAALFDYPLKPAEIHERLFEVTADRAEFDAVLKAEKISRVGEFVSESRSQVEARIFREAISDRAIDKSWEKLGTLSSVPFVRMLAFSGATAHRNMSNDEDLDLFMIVEDGKVWFTFLVAILWAKWRGVRKTFCINYVVSDRALPLFHHDAFTAQQMASLKPFYGKSCYDRLLAANPFVRRFFPNFQARRHREMYKEIETGGLKRVIEGVLRIGIVQTLDRVSRIGLGWHLARKVQAASKTGICDVVLEPARLKLHLRSHRESVLGKI